MAARGCKLKSFQLLAVRGCKLQPSAKEDPELERERVFDLQSCLETSFARLLWTALCLQARFALALGGWGSCRCILNSLRRGMLWGQACREMNLSPLAFFEEECCPDCPGCRWDCLDLLAERPPVVLLAACTSLRLRPVIGGPCPILSKQPPNELMPTAAESCQNLRTRISSAADR